MIRPKKLRKGDTVGFICPAGKITKERLEKAKEKADKLGVKYKIGDSCISSYAYLAGSDNIRTKDINSMFENPSIDGIFCLRGGYGSQRILDRIDYELISKNPKIICGFSDITALLNTIYAKTGLITYHTPMLGTEIFDYENNYSFESFRKTIFHNKNINEIASHSDYEIETYNTNKNVEGEIVGGNLAVITSSLGTAYQINCDNKILFLEDVNEDVYKIDRMLNHMRLARKFDKCKGLIIGQFTDCCKNDEEQKYLKNVFVEISNRHNLPTMFNFSIGHIFHSVSIPIGEKYFMDFDKKSLIFRG